MLLYIGSYWHHSVLLTAARLRYQRLKVIPIVTTSRATAALGRITILGRRSKRGPLYRRVRCRPIVVRPLNIGPRRGLHERESTQPSLETFRYRAKQAASGRLTPLPRPALLFVLCRQLGQLARVPHSAGNHALSDKHRGVLCHGRQPLSGPGQGDLLVEPLVIAVRVAVPAG